MRTLEQIVDDLTALHYRKVYSIDNYETFVNTDQHYGFTIDKYHGTVPLLLDIDDDAESAEMLEGVEDYLDDTLLALATEYVQACIYEKIRADAAEEIAKQERDRLIRSRNRNTKKSSTTTTTTEAEAEPTENK